MKLVKVTAAIASLLLLSIGATYVVSGCFEFVNGERFLLNVIFILNFFVSNQVAKKFMGVDADVVGVRLFGMDIKLRPVLAMFDAFVTLFIFAWFANKF